MRTPQDDLERKRLNARGRQILQQKKEGGIVRPARSDGYVNLLNKYGTKQDNTEAYHFEREPIVPDMQITGLYEGNGLFAKIIDTPAEEALKHGFDLGLNDEDLDRYVEDALDGLEWEEKATTAIKWARLYGGSIIVMLVDDGRGLEEPLDWQAIKSIDELRVYERAVVQPDYASLYLQDYGGLGPGNRVSKFGRPEFYYVSSIYGSFKVHESRCLVFRNGVLPEQVTNSTYQMWGMPEFVRIRRSLRETVTAHTDSTKLLERSVQAIYKMKGLAQILATDLGDEKVLKRLEVIDMARGILNSLVIDSDGEDYDFKTFQFSGVRDVIDACCNMLSALTNIPQTILFGRSPAGMDATGQSDLENYYNFIERIQKLMLKANLRNLLDIIFRAAVTGGELDQIPDYHLKFNPLWSMSDTEQANVEKTRADTAMVKAQTAQLYVDMQALDASEVRRKLASDDEFIVEDIISGEDDTDLLESVLGVTPEDVSDVEAAQMNEEQQQAPGGSEQSAEGSAQQTAPSVPAPAANPTQPPRPEAADDEDTAAKDGGPGSGNFGHEGRPGKVGGSSEGGSEGKKGVENHEEKEYHVSVSEQDKKLLDKHVKRMNQQAKGIASVKGDDDSAAQASFGKSTITTSEFAQRSVDAVEGWSDEDRWLDAAYTGAVMGIGENTGVEYSELNRKLRSGESLSDTEQAVVDHFKRCSEPVGRDVDLYRKVGEDYLDAIVKQTGAKSIEDLVGKTVKNDAIQSTCAGVSSFFEKERVTLKIKTPADTRVCFTSDVGEGEIVIPPGARMKVSRVETNRPDIDLPCWNTVRGPYGGGVQTNAKNCGYRSFFTGELQTARKSRFYIEMEIVP